MPTVGDAVLRHAPGPSGKYDEIGSKSGHGGGGEREGMDANIAMLEKEHEEITKVLHMMLFSFFNP